MLIGPSPPCSERPSYIMGLTPGEPAWSRPHRHTVGRLAFTLAMLWAVLGQGPGLTWTLALSLPAWSEEPPPTSGHWKGTGPERGGGQCPERVPTAAQVQGGVSLTGRPCAGAWLGGWWDPGQSPPLRPHWPMGQGGLVSACSRQGALPTSWRHQRAPADEGDSPGWRCPRPRPAADERWKRITPAALPSRLRGARAVGG